MRFLLHKRQREEFIKRLKNKFNNVFTIFQSDKKIKFYLPTFDDHIQRRIIVSDTFFEAAELKKASKYVPSNAIVFDIGSNIGNHLVYFSKILNANKVYGFEPQKNIYEILNENSTINQCNADIFNYALGSNKGQAGIKNSNKYNLGATSIAS